MPKKARTLNAEQTFPKAKGTYVLVLRLAGDHVLRIGALGEVAFLAGWYAYVGSAHGPGGLAGRLKHHLRPVVRPHWHIDYLRQAASVREVWYAVSDEPLEACWAEALASTAEATPVPRFGCSDSACDSHLFHWQRQPAITLPHLSGHVLL